MKKCYADSTLDISLEDFERPEKLSINIDCGGKKKGEEDEEVKKVVIKEDIEF